ncbi:MAG TPA: hypothetical protein VIM44_01590 [Rariglobus sp.]
MKKFFAVLLALLSGGYLLTLGIAPDPLPFLDEATALLILVKSLSVLGIDLTRYVPFLSGRLKQRKQVTKPGPTIDV